MSKSTSISRTMNRLSRGTLWLVILACAAGMTVLVERARSQRAAVRAIEDLGGSVTYDFEVRGLAEPPGPRWLRAWIGDDYFARVEIVMLWDPSTADADLEHVADLTRVKQLYLMETQITDAGVSLLSRMKSLELLNLRDTLVSEDAKSRLEQQLPTCLIR